MHRWSHIWRERVDHAKFHHFGLWVGRCTPKTVFFALFRNINASHWRVHCALLTKFSEIVGNSITKSYHPDRQTDRHSHSRPIVLVSLDHSTVVILIACGCLVAVEVSSSEERRIVPSDSAASGAICRLLPTSSLSFLVSGTVIVQLYRC